MPDHPNILFVMTDHAHAAALAKDSPCHTPNLDRVAREGVRLGRCYTPNAICSPSRASLMTGTYPSTHGVWDCTHTQRPAWVDVAPHLRLFSQTLREAGYHTGYFGKWHVEQTGDLARYGWDEFDLGCASRKTSPVLGTELLVATPGYREYLLAAEGAPAANGSAADAAGPSVNLPQHPAFDKGIDFLRRHAAEEAERPLCCFVSTAEPHDPYIPPPEFLHLYDVAKAPLPPTLRSDLGGKPEVLRRMQAVWRGLSDDDWRFVRTAYWATISFLDAEVGRLLNVLRELDLERDTIVVFTSDHGDMLGAHGLAAKGVGTSYEPVYNVPLVIRGPSIRPREDDTQTVTSLVDLAPTLLDLAGCQPLPDAQGRSIRGVLDGTAEPAEHQDAYAEFFGQRFVYTQRIVWHGRWKYVFSPGGIDELYDLADDPHEEHNLAPLPGDRPADPRIRDAHRRMVRQMWKTMHALGDTSLANTHYATLRTAPFGPLEDAPESL